MNKRIEWIDIVKFVCMICVMATHFSFNNHELRTLYYPFFLVLFYFCAGYCYRRKSSFREHFISKVKQLLIPWLVFSNLNIILSAIISFKEHDNVVVEILRNMLQIRGYGDILWFLSSLFVAYLFFYFVERSIDDKKKANGYLLLFSVLYFVRELYVVYFDGSIFFWNRPDLPWRIDYIPNMLLYMLFGYYFKLYLEKQFDSINSVLFRIVGTVLYILIARVYIETRTFPREVAYIAIDYLKHIMGSLIVIAWCKKIKTNKYISFVGQNTLSYFCIHNKVITFVEVFLFTMMPSLKKILIENTFLGSIANIAGSLIISVILIIPTLFMIKFCPRLIGKWPNKSTKLSA